MQHLLDKARAALRASRERAAKNEGRAPSYCQNNDGRLADILTDDGRLLCGRCYLKEGAQA